MRLKHFIPMYIILKKYSIPSKTRYTTSFTFVYNIIKLYNMKQCIDINNVFNKV